MAEEQQNMYLIFKYLTEEFKNAGADNPEDKAEELILANSSNLFGYHGLAWQLGKLNMEFFCMYFLQDTFLPKENNAARNLAPVHLEIWRELQKMFVDDLYDKEEFILPRGCSKSTIINKALSCYTHAYLISRYTIVIGNTESDSVQFISDTRKMLENKYIVKGFGKLIDKKDRTLNKQEIELTNNSKIQAFSWGSSVRGTTYGSIDGIFRPSCIICDDVLSENDILSDNAKEKVINKFYKEIAEVGDSAVYRNGVKIKTTTKFIVIGTPLAPDDFINTIREDPTFKVFHKKVVDFDIDEYFNNNEYWQNYNKILINDKLHKDEKDTVLDNYYLENIDKMRFETIWEKYECDKLAQKYFTKRTAFMQELMCDCQNISEKWFKSNRIQPTKEIENHTFSKTIFCIDPAGIKNKKKGDYFAFVVQSLADNDFKYIRLGEILHFANFDEYIKHMIDVLIMFEDIKHINIEKNTYMGLDLEKLKEEISKNDILRNRDFVFINEMQKKNKDEKISTIVDSVNSGRIIFDEERVMNKALNQMMDFQGQLYTLHDDFVDCVAEASNKIDTVMIIPKIKLYDRRLFGF